MLENQRNSRPKTNPMKPASRSGERTPGARFLLSSPRTPETRISGEDAIRSRQGALEPAAGGRAALLWISDFSFSIAIRVGGTTEAVVRLPPDAGPTDSAGPPMGAPPS